VPFVSSKPSVGRETLPCPGTPLQVQIFNSLLRGVSVSCQLLESERRGFGVMLALQCIVGRCLATVITITKGPATKNVGPLIVLDEYIDKDLTPVRARLRRLLSALNADPRVQLQVIVVTHSRNVMDEADYVIALKVAASFPGDPHWRSRLIPAAQHIP
jgi:hypothetical protein